MRFERRGELPPRLTPRLENFITEGFGGKSLDDLVDAEQRRADYLCLNGLLVIEVKSLVNDASERIDNVLEELRKRKDWPVFYGRASLDAIIKNLSDAEEVRKLVNNRIGRPIRDHLSKANRQLGAHAEKFPRKNLVRLMLLINEDHEIYEPEITGHAIQQALKEKRGDAQRYGNVDAVIFMSERHVTRLEQRIVFPMIMVKGAPLVQEVWKQGVLDNFAKAWAAWNGHPYFDTDDFPSFATVEHVPEKMRRQELWELQYRRKPYMKDMSDEELRCRFDEVVCYELFAHLKDSPAKEIERELIARYTERRTHVTMEMNRRGIPVTAFQGSPERLKAAAQRMQAPPEAIEWLVRVVQGRAGQPAEPA